MKMTKEEKITVDFVMNRCEKLLANPENAEKFERLKRAHGKEYAFNWIYTYATTTIMREAKFIERMKKRK